MVPEASDEQILRRLKLGPQTCARLPRASASTTGQGTFALSSVQPGVGRPWGLLLPHHRRGSRTPVGHIKVSGGTMSEHQPDTVTYLRVPRLPSESAVSACRQGLEGLEGTGCHTRSTLVMKGSAVRIRASASVSKPFLACLFIPEWLCVKCLRQVEPSEARRGLTSSSTDEEGEADRFTHQKSADARAGAGCALSS
jgi:hypothetical protein